jgi:hypothetical protein
MRALWSDIAVACRGYPRFDFKPERRGWPGQARPRRNTKRDRVRVGPRISLRSSGLHFHPEGRSRMPAVNGRSPHEQSEMRGIMVVMPALVAGIHVSISNQKDVDGRVKPGHDEIQNEIGSALIPGYRFAHPGYTSLTTPGRLPWRGGCHHDKGSAWSRGARREIGWYAMSSAPAHGVPATGLLAAETAASAWRLRPTRH